jgi:hypothetical protein
MQHGEMLRIAVALVGLEIVAVDQHLGGPHRLRRRIDPRELRERQRFAGAHVGKDHAVHFPARVRRMAHFIHERAARGFARHLETASVRRHEPTVIETPQRAALDAGITQVGTAMRTPHADQARRSVLAAKEHQVLAQHAHRNRRVGQLLRERDRMPVAAHQRPARRAGADFRQAFVLLLR